MDPMNKIYGLSFAFRLVLMLYGAWQDANMAVQFTDVDYHVFTDAAKFVSHGESPYKRATYRYTPLLSWALTLNVWISPFFGKFLFIIFDILVGKSIYNLVRHNGFDHWIARNCTLVWLINPLSATVSSRGNAESIMAFLVLTSLSLLVQGKLLPAAVMYAIAVHFKIYPVTYALPIYLYLGSEDVKGADRWSSWMRSLLPNKERLLFISTSVAVLVSLSCFFYWMYGWVFLYETYLYHIVRGDIRHNFSPYFYLLYLTSDPVNGVPLCLRLLVFIPQLVLVVAVALRCHHDQPLAWFLCTFIFVMANKVCTSQYFLWYLSLLPIILPHLKMTLLKSLQLLLLWFGAQGLWLLSAYYLEFNGSNTFIYIWAAGLLFFCVNSYITYCLLTSYDLKAKSK